MVTSPEVTPRPATKTSRPPETPDDLPRIVPRRHPGRWLTAALALLLFAMLLNSVVRNDAFQWDVVGRYFTTAAVLDGLLLSLWLTVIGLTLHESAYAAEVVRGGILSVDAGQTEAAQATAARLVIGGDR